MTDWAARDARQRAAIREWVQRNRDALETPVKLACGACGSPVAAGIIAPRVAPGERVDLGHAVTSGPVTLDVLAQALRVTPAPHVIDGIAVWRCARCSSRGAAVVGAADAVDRARAAWLDNARRRRADRAARLTVTLPRL